MAEEETTQKMESLILELNKTGLAYLVSSTPFIIKISLDRLWIISRKLKKQSRRSLRSTPVIKKSIKLQASRLTILHAITKST